MSPIPFSLPDLNMGFTEVKGAVYMDEEFLVLDIETSLFGEINTGDSIIKVEPTALREVRIETRIFRDRLVLVPKKRDLLDAVPGSHKGELQLRIWRKHRPKTHELVFELNHRITVGK